jgi:membrane-bound serine protease (ClpP class)
MNRPRLIIAVVSTILEEAAIAAIFLWGLPKINVHLPVWIMIVIMLGWLFYSVYTFRKGTRALKIGHIIGLPNMIGTRGKVVSVLNPEGWVKIRGELWSAKSVSGELRPGSKILVTGQSRLKLDVSADCERTGRPTQPR